MATANELFAANGEDYIVIDSDLRTMTFPASVNNIGVENDKDVYKLNFKMPRYFSGYDLSEFIIHINYVNANGDGDMYYVLDPTVEENEIIFSWLVGRHACLYRGAVTFIVCLKLADGEGDVAQEYNTTLASLQVLPGLETEPTILETDYDIIEQLLLTIQDTNDKIKAVLDSGMTAEELGNIAKEQKTLKSRMDEFASLPDGSTTGDAELADIRVAADGTRYASAGEAVRGQVNDLKSAGEAVRGQVNDLKSALYDNEIIDAFEDGTYNNSTWRGVTLTWNGKTAHLEGTATGGNFTSPNIFANANGFPANISAGDVINVNIARTTNVYLNIFSYVNNSLSNEAAIQRTQKYTIPENATGLLIRLFVYNGATVNGNISFMITKSATVKSQEAILPTIPPAKDSIVDTIESVLNKFGIAVLGKGTYELARAINMPDGSMIKGAGEATVIKAATGSDAIVAGASCSIENVKIHSDTGYTNSVGTAAGIRLSGNYDTPPLKYNIKISNVTIDGFPLAGIYGTKTGTWVGDSISAVNCTIFNCYAGLFLEDYSEFGRYTNIMCRDNYIGLHNKSGNNVFENCSFSNNTIGVYLIGDDGDNSRNNGHGTLVGCTINHSNNNNGFAVVCKGISNNGFVFNGCQVWYGKIQVEQSSGIIFDGCMFGAYDTNTEIINYTANDLFLMNCLFKVGATFSGSGGETHTVNCFKFDGTPVSVP